MLCPTFALGRVLPRAVRHPHRRRHLCDVDVAPWRPVDHDLTTHLDSTITTRPQAGSMIHFFIDYPVMERLARMQSGNLLLQVGGFGLERAVFCQNHQTLPPRSSKSIVGGKWRRISALPTTKTSNAVPRMRNIGISRVELPGA